MASKRAATKPTAVRSTGAKSTATAKPDTRPRILSRSIVLPAAGIGVITVVLAAQDGASFPIALVVGIAVTAVVIGMIALKRAFYGD